MSEPPCPCRHTIKVLETRLHAAEEVAERLKDYVQHDIECDQMDVSGHDPDKGYMIRRSGKLTYQKELPLCTCGLDTALRGGGEG